MGVGGDLGRVEREVLRLLSARSLFGVPTVRENETAKQVQGGHTSTDPGGILARSTGVITDLAGGRGVEMYE